MKFEHPSEPDESYRITFQGDEIDVMQGMYVEDIAANFKLGNTGSLSRHEQRVAMWPKSGPDSDEIAAFHSYQTLVEKLLDFHNRTDSVLIEMSIDPAKPDFMKTELITRKILGDKALKLAEAITEAAENPLPPLPDPETIDIDSGLSELFGNQDENQ
jgi:hypothetical protein